MPSLDLTSLEDALMQLDAGLREAEGHKESELLRDGVIHRFGYSHELAIKLIRRALETVFDDPVDQMPYNDVLRTAAERGIIPDIEPWFGYRETRNKMSHTYDGAVAADVFRSARPFLAHGRALLQRLHALGDTAAA